MHGDDNKLSEKLMRLYLLVSQQLSFRGAVIHLFDDRVTRGKSGLIFAAGVSPTEIETNSSDSD